MTNIFRSRNEDRNVLRSSPYLKWLLIIAAGIFLLRILIVILFSRSSFEQGRLFDIIGKVMSNTFATIILVCVNIMFVRSLANRGKSLSTVGTYVIYVTFMLLATLLETFLVGIEDTDFLLLFCISLMAQITVYCIVYMINYAITAQHEMQNEREKANMAQYRYLKLKRQVNPHFLFNSLNILDCLVCEEKTEQASSYIHKLAGIYRYMIKSEEEQIVTMREELEFVRRYLDLLELRFPEGLEVDLNVPEEVMSRYVLPCSIQLLIENATKHNTVSSENPLVIEVEVKDDKVIVRNNLIPKVTKSSSTGLGQKYIRQLYHDLSGKDIVIGKTETDYCVTLPLL